MEKRLIAQSNRITEAKYDFSVMEKRAIYFIIELLRKELDGKISLKEDLFEDKYFEIENDKLLNASANISEIKNAFRGLNTKAFEIETSEEDWERFYFIERPKMSKGKINFRVPKPIWKELLNLSEKFTIYSATVALSLKKKGSQRFYEYCCQYKNAGGFYIGFDELRERLMISNQERYSRWSNIEKVYVEPAQIELKELYENGLSDLYFEYKPHKSGRTTLGVRFKIITRNKTSIDNYKPEDFIHYIREWLNSWFMTTEKPKNKQLVSNVINHVIFEPDDAKEIYLKLDRVKNTYESSDQWAKITRIILKQDYDID